ncbi:MAG: hypothetical protein HY002_12810 [Candidatus Rokubacteria bacterium]|nr:hypothetical protein [Candidatus Rokubacteria bacterium]
MVRDIPRYRSWPRLAAALAVLVVAYCLASLPPGASTEPMCEAPGMAPKICAQAGSADPVPAIAPAVPRLSDAPASMVGVPIPTGPRRAVQVYPASFPPRAPPLPA